MSSCSPLEKDTPPTGASQGRAVAGNRPRADQPDGWPDLDSPRVSGVKSYQGGTSHKSRAGGPTLAIRNASHRGTHFIWYQTFGRGGVSTANIPQRFSTPRPPWRSNVLDGGGEDRRGLHPSAPVDNRKKHDTNGKALPAFHGWGSFFLAPTPVRWEERPQAVVPIPPACPRGPYVPLKAVRQSCGSPRYIV